MHNSFQSRHEDLEKRGIGIGKVESVDEVLVDCALDSVPDWAHGD